jgi:hypothetical protein
VIKVPGYRSRGPGSFPGSARFSKKRVWSTIEELLGRKSDSGLETEITIVGDPPRWLPDIPPSTKVGTNFDGRGGHSVGIVRSRTQATELVCCFVSLCLSFELLTAMITKSTAA